MVHIAHSRRAVLGMATGALSAFALERALRGAGAEPTSAGKWKGLHLCISGDGGLKSLAEQAHALADVGVNVAVIEINYAFDFKSHPELSDGARVTAKQCKATALACREKGIRLIPGFNCLGHQSWKKATFPLLRKYPELDETPGKYPENEGIYCRSWCPRHPQVNGIVFALLDELADAFDSDAIHVGMDEVFLVSSEFCPRCKGTDPAESFARAVNDIHGHVTGERKLQMLMWGDRFLDGKATGYGEWEASKNGTYAAIDHVPKDIIVCDWHYEKRAEYPSIPLLLKKGFRVWPAGWKSEPATVALRDYAKGHADEKVLGHLCTTWGSVAMDKLAEWPPVLAGMGKE
jgi:hypothetical protein